MTDFNAPAAAQKETDAPDGERDQPTAAPAPSASSPSSRAARARWSSAGSSTTGWPWCASSCSPSSSSSRWSAGRLWTYGYDEITDSFNTPPFRALDENGELVWSAQHPMGTDTEGHDFMALILRGAQKSVQIMLLVAFLSTAIGIVYGAVSGYYSGRIDGVMMRILDVLFTIPLLRHPHRAVEEDRGQRELALRGPPAGSARVVLAGPAGAGRVPVVAGEGVRRGGPGLGAGDARIIFRHILPNTVGTIIVSATLTMATAILLETALSFLGLGIRSPDTSLGLLVSRYQAASTTRPWLFYIPGVFIVIIALCVNFVGDGLRDAFDPKQQRVRQ